MRRLLLLVVILMMLQVVGNVYAQMDISGHYPYIQDVITSPDTLLPDESDTTSWLNYGLWEAYTVFGLYRIVSGDSIGGTIKYELDCRYKPRFSEDNIPHIKMGETGAKTIVTFAPSDTGYKYFDLHQPVSTAPSPAARIRFIITNTTSDTFYIDDMYLFCQP